MSEQEKRILETFSEVLPTLSKQERERLLAYGEGMAFVKNNPADKQSQSAV